jgi:hypothetical protein
MTPREGFAWERGSAAPLKPGARPADPRKNVMSIIKMQTQSSDIQAGCA